MGINALYAKLVDCWYSMIYTLTGHYMVVLIVGGFNMIFSRIIMFFVIMIKGKYKVTDERYIKTPYWKRDKTAWQIFKVNAKTLWSRFDTQTRGMGVLLVILMVFMIVINVMGAIVGSVYSYLNNQKYSDALKGGCTDKTFYAWNFKACEDAGVRPTQ